MLSIAHRLSTVIGADTIHVLEAGKIVESGTHQELLARGGLYSELAAQQMAAAKIEGVEAAAVARIRRDRRPDRAPAETGAMVPVAFLGGVPAQDVPDSDAFRFHL